MAIKKILIAEDETIIAYDIKTSLLKDGFQVTGISRTGEETLRKTSEYKPDLILMDIRLKGNIDGIQAAHTIQKDNKIPIVFVSGSTDQSTMNRLKENPASYFIGKPFDAMELRSAIRLMEKRRKYKTRKTFSVND